MTRAIIFDTELTDKENGEIIEAAWLEFSQVTDLAGISDAISRETEWSTPDCYRFNPSKPMSLGAIAVHGILPHELHTCPPSSTFSLPSGVDYIIGHSIDTDWIAAGSPDVKRICTYAMSQHVWPDADAYSQSALVYMLLGVNEDTRELVRRAHGASEDVLLNKVILFAILDAHSEIKTWNELWEFSEQCRIPLVCPFQKHRGTPLSELDDDYIDWCLRQHWIDPYLRKGLEQVMDDRNELFEAESARRYEARAKLANNSIGFDDDLPF